MVGVSLVVFEGVRRCDAGACDHCDGRDPGG
jgi:hypothetical protein